MFRVPRALSPPAKTHCPLHLVTPAKYAKSAKRSSKPTSRREQRTQRRRRIRTARGAIIYRTLHSAQKRFADSATRRILSCAHRRRSADWQSSVLRPQSSVLLVPSCSKTFYPHSCQAKIREIRVCPAMRSLRSLRFIFRPREDYTTEFVSLPYPCDRCSSVVGNPLP